MRRVLMVTPHFPPDSSAASHRVRLLAPHLPAAGWRPTIVTVEPGRYENRLDPRLADLIPSSLDVVRARAWPARWTRRIGVGDLGLRAFAGLRRACRSLLSRDAFDALFITVYPVYPALLGPQLKAEFGIPFVLDYQDPWVGEWGKSVGGGADGSPDWKSRMSRRLGQWLEPRAVQAADALVAVSQGTIDGIVDRIPSASQVPHDVIPVGFEPQDFECLRAHPRASGVFDAGDGLVHLCYVGTLLPTGVDTLRLLLTGLARLREMNPVAARLRLHFFGTSNQSSADRLRAMPVAAECGVADLVTENPGRLDYFDALGALVQADAILLLGSSETHYTASKLGPALLARRPVLALYNEASSVVSMLAASGREPSVRLVTYGRDVLTEARVTEVAGHLEALARGQGYRPSDVDLAQGRRVFCRAPLSTAGRASQSGGSVTPIRLTVVLTHPIQYYSPWFRHVTSQAPELALTVVHATEPTPEQQGVGFDRPFSWDVPLTDGFRSVVVRGAKPEDRVDSAHFRGLDVPEIGEAIAATRPDVALITGWYSITLVRALHACRRLGVPALYRGDSHLLSGPHGLRRSVWAIKTRYLLSRFDGYLSPGRRVNEYLRTIRRSRLPHLRRAACGRQRDVPVDGGALSGAFTPC